MIANRVRKGGIIAASVALLALTGGPALAADDAVSASHLKAAYEAIAAIHATTAFDTILPRAAAALKHQLIVESPNLQDVIISTVDKDTLAIADRRGDLEKEAARTYAKLFSEKELNDIASFYNSPAGKKLLESGPLASRQIANAAEIWQRGVARDLAAKVSQDLQKAEGAKAPAVKAPAKGAAKAGAASTGSGAAKK